MGFVFFRFCIGEYPRIHTDSRFSFHVKKFGKSAFVAPARESDLFTGGWISTFDQLYPHRGNESYGRLRLRLNCHRRDGFHVMGYRRDEYGPVHCRKVTFEERIFYAEHIPLGLALYLLRELRLGDKEKRNERLRPENLSDPGLSHTLEAVMQPEAKLPWRVTASIGHWQEPV
ncbi:MAG: hypothetical protein AAF550_05925 [Myxococcota bacterium]